jgi:hypothetical protein
MEWMRMMSNDGMKRKTKYAQKIAHVISDRSSDQDMYALENEGEYIDSKGILTLKYEVDERGIGQLLIPPSLSLLLQSDRVSISPAAGGLFIRSV